MGRNKVNTYKKVLRHLKSTQIDEKIQLLSEVPTNNTSGIYVIEPESIVQDPDIPGEVTVEANFTADALQNGRDTTGLFDIDNTTILTIEPPGDTTYVLGPMASMWYSWGNFSTIGYIRQSDRRMVDLGRITGQLGSWNGSSNFTSYGQLSLAQAVWFRDTPKLNGDNNDTPNYRAFYPGPPSNSPDQFGRYLCVITGTSKETTVTPPPRRDPPAMGGFDPNILPGSANPNTRNNDISQLSDYTDRKIDLMLLKGLQRGDYGTGPNIDKQIKNLQQNLQQGFPGGGRLPLVQVNPGTQVAHYTPHGNIILESTKSILKNIKKPYVLPEIPKQKYKIKLSHNNRTINPDLMKKAEVPSSFKKAEDKLWGKYEKEQNARMSQERKNEVLDHLGGGDHFWEYMTETSRSKNKDIQYTNFGDKSKKIKGKIVRKEELKGDHLVFLQDEQTNKKNTILQSEINDLLAQEYMPDEFKIFFEDQNETEKYEKDPLFKKVSKRLKKEIDYPDKPAKNGYPNDPPPEMVNGMHPDLVDGKQIVDRFNRLDPQSAEAMPPTGNVEIDKKVRAAAKKPK